MSQEVSSAFVTAGLFALFVVWVPLLAWLEHLAHHFLFHQPPRVLTFSEPHRDGRAKQASSAEPVLRSGPALEASATLARSAEP